MYWWTKSLLLAGSGLLSQSAALPTDFDHQRDDFPVAAEHPFAEFGHVPSLKLKREDKVDLRIMPLGASIMAGIGSSNGNGLRKPLRDALRFDGFNVDMVGGRNDGPMKDNDHEAVPGEIVSEIRTRVGHAVGYKANVIIINAGTNDANGGILLDGIKGRMNGMLDDIWQSEDMGRACVVMSTLLDTTNANGNKNRLYINNQYRELVNDRQKEGKCIAMADMDPEKGPQHGWIKAGAVDRESEWEDYYDKETPKVHPNDVGHKKMAYIFYKTILRLAALQQIQPPSKDFAVADPVCDKKSGSGINPGGRTQRGSGNDDDVYRHYSKEMGIIWSAESEWDRDQWRFARLFSDKYDDFVAWIKGDGDNNDVFAVWANSADGAGKFTKAAKDISIFMKCDPAGQYFIDMNGDGLDDFVCIDKNGNAHLSINQGDGSRKDGRVPTFKNLGQIKSAEVSSRDNVRMADIDGDGRGDYVAIDKLGTVTVWRNGWVDDKPKYWQSLGVRWQDQYTRDIKGVQFHDINGDGRDDWLWKDKTGATTTFINNRACQKGKEGNGLKVAWRQGFFQKEGTGPTHKGLPGYVTKSESDLRKRVHFARVYGGSSSFGNLSLKDYVFLEHEKLKNGDHSFKMRVWKNEGGGASKLKMDGNKYCNMVGHKDGKSDYVWVWSNGKMELFINRGRRAINNDDPLGFWDWTPGVIWTPPRAMHRLDLHLADWDGDGACDIIYVDPKTNVVEVFINQFPKTQKWQFNSISVQAPNCGGRRGVGINDLAVRFADLTGNGRADMLCLEPNGRVQGFLHQNDGKFKVVGQIKIDEGHDRANLRFADVNGDGKADLLWIEKFSGDTWVWYNDGEDESRPLGSAFHWRQQKEMAYAGLAAGQCIYYTDLSGDFRADEHFVLESFNNIAETSFSPACGLSNAEGDDPEGVVDPKLPVRPEDPNNQDDQVPEGICGYTYWGTTQQTLKTTWEKSGAAEHLTEWFNVNSVDDWAKTYLRQATGGNNDDGGSQLDCGNILEKTCVGPQKVCSEYTPNEAYFVHHQVANMNSAMFSFWAKMVNGTSGILHNEIIEIVKKYGTPDDDASPILNMLVGLFTSLAGISGTLGDQLTVGPATALGKFVNPATFIAGAIAIAATEEGKSAKISPDQLEKDLQQSYAKMFERISNHTQTTVGAALKGENPGGVGDMKQYILNSFADGAWLSSDVTNIMIDAMFEGVFRKFKEFAVIQGMQTESKKKYRVFVYEAGYTSNSGKNVMDEALCLSEPARIWHENHCVGLGYADPVPMLGDVDRQLNEGELNDVKRWVKDVPAALVNNYECYKRNGKAGKLEEPDFPGRFNPDSMLEYTPCFWNLFVKEYLKDD